MYPNLHPSQKSKTWVVWWFLFGAAVFLYLLLFIPTRAPVYRASDNSVYVMNAMRMLNGQLIYRDFFQFTLPGTELVFFALFKLFGVRQWIPNAVLLFLGLSLTWLSITISKKVMSAQTALLPSLLFLTFAFPNKVDASHHWFSVLAVMAAVAIVTEKRTPARLAWVGALCGLALFFTQSRGIAAVLGFAVFLLWERQRKGESWNTLLKNQVYLFAPFLCTSFGASAYFVWRASIGQFLFDAVIFGVRYHPTYSDANGLKAYLFSPPDIRHWYSVPWLGVYVLIHILVPVTYVIFLLRYRVEARTRLTTPWDRLMLLNIVGLFLFLGVAPAPSFPRLCTVSLPALILTVWLGALPRKPEQFLTRCLWAFALMLAVVEPLSIQRRRLPILDLPAGPTALWQPGWYEKYKWLREYTKPSEFFFEGAWADVYFPLHLQNPATAPFLSATDYTRPEQVQEALKALEQHRVRFVLWSLELDVPRDYLPAADHLGPFRDYLHTHYHVVKSFPDYDQAWERNQQLSEGKQR